MRKGDPGDHYVLIAEGRIDVSDDGRPLATLGTGDGVGEIALLRAVPRTATATAATAVEAYTIGSPAFLEAVAGPAAAAAAETVVAERLERSRTGG
jgi:CRP-like cAMP-binding protein